MKDVSTDTVEEPPGDALLPGAEPYSAGPAEGAEIGVLLCHGFTGSPQSMRPWGEYLAARHPDYSIEAPLLPGHGRPWPELQRTTWRDWYATYEKYFLSLRARCGQVYVMGLSMGAGLALRLAEEYPSDVAGLVVVNPSVTRNKPAEALLPIVSKLIPSLPAIASDIKKPGAVEVGSTRTPLRAANSLSQFWGVVAADLPKVVAPMLLLHSAEDHVVHPRNSALVLASVSSPQKEEVVLRDSYHVATLDNDAELVFDRSAAFVEKVRHGRKGVPAS